MHEILALCSRDHGHKEVYSRLTRALEQFDKTQKCWNQLIHEAEVQGIAPLVSRHISKSGYYLSKDIRRLLQTLKLRTERANQIRNQLIIDILNKFTQSNIDLILLKGIAFCNMVYSTPGSRPMRDIDILVKKKDIDRVRVLLSKLNFEQEFSTHIPDDYHHLQPFIKKINGLPVTIEVHRELLPKHFNQPSWYFEPLCRHSLEFSINRTNTKTLGLEQTIYYKYLHGFRAPLTFEPFRLLHCADIISLVEKYHEEICWNKLEHMFPTVYNVLSRLHFLTPWNPKVIKALPLNIKTRSAQIGIPYNGWPSRHPKSVPAAEMFGYIKETLWPPQWWTQVYYGHLDGRNYLKARLINHPQTLWRWVKAFRHSYKVA